MVNYCTREDVKSALDINEAARMNTRIDNAIVAASRFIDGSVPGDGFLHRRFYPEIRTAYFSWPNDQYARAWRIWLDANELISVSQLVSGGTTLAPGDYLLEPATEGPPYDSVELNRGASVAFASGSTSQRAIAITGVFGFSAQDAPAGALAEALDAVETAVDVTDSQIIGIGHVIKCESERMIVTGKAMLSTGQTLQTPVTLNAADVTLAVTSGAAYAVGETLLLDAERMLIVDVAGNNVIVKRAWDGTVLAAHNGSTIYAPRTLTVERGALGTTAAVHNTATALTYHVVPGLVRELCLAEAIGNFLSANAGYARTIGSGEGERNASMNGLLDIRKRARAAYGRIGRMSTV